MPVLVRIEGALTAALREELARAGLMLHGAVGEVVSGSIRAADIFHLTGLGAVRLVSLPAAFHIQPPVE